MESMEKSVEVETEKFQSVAGPAGEIFIFDQGGHTVCVIPSTNPNAARHARLLLAAPELLLLAEAGAQLARIFVDDGFRTAPAVKEAFEFGIAKAKGGSK